MPTLTPLTDAQITDRLAALRGWTRDGSLITRTFTLDRYLDGIALAAAIGTICEGLDHHPEMMIGYKRVTVSFTTHDADGLTSNDFDAAAAIDALPFPKQKA